MYIDSTGIYINDEVVEKLLWEAADCDHFKDIAETHFRKEGEWPTSVSLIPFEDIKEIIPNWQRLIQINCNIFDFYDLEKTIAWAESTWWVVVDGLEITHFHHFDSEIEARNFYIEEIKNG